MAKSEVCASGEQSCYDLNGNRKDGNGVGGKIQWNMSNYTGGISK